MIEELNGLLVHGYFITTEQYYQHSKDYMEKTFFYLCVFLVSKQNDRYYKSSEINNFIRTEVQKTIPNVSPGFNPLHWLSACWTAYENSLKDDRYINLDAQKFIPGIADWIDRQRKGVIEFRIKDEYYSELEQFLTYFLSYQKNIGNDSLIVLNEDNDPVKKQIESLKINLNEINEKKPDNNNPIKNDSSIIEHRDINSRNNKPKFFKKNINVLNTVNNKKKYLQIFNYLLEFSKIRNKSVRDIKNSSKYLDIIWLSDIPQNIAIDFIMHNNFSENENYWLKITKPNEPEQPIFPEPPEELNNWIEIESIYNRDEFPILKSEIIVANNLAIIEDHPEIKIIFEDYCENKWFIDSDEYWRKREKYDIEFAEYQKVNLIYKRLFSLYNKSQQFGEEYEIILGTGLMYFKENNETPLICRHILTTQTEVQFDFSKRDSNIIVSQNIENELELEIDAIIDLFEQFEPNDIIDGEKLATELMKTKEILDPFASEIHEVLQLFAERIKPGDGKYLEDLKTGKVIPQKETIYYAPALILRKRDSRSFSTLYETIIEQIDAAEEINIPILNELIAESDQLDSNQRNTNTQINNANYEVDTVYFPNKFNDEQLRIVEKARFNDKVLVQGPPGTGKSHTIANLICHLLAKGKKILVTAYTKRALEVLKDKLPEEFNNLTVNLLSGDSASIQNLEASVKRINYELSNTDIETLRVEIDQLELQLEQLKEKRTFDTNELLKIKEKSSRRLSINPSYQGSITEIAEKLDSDKREFTWYNDDFDSYQNDEIIFKLESYLKHFNYYSNIDESIFNYKLPKIENLVDIDNFLDYKNNYQRIMQNNLSKDVCNIIESTNLDIVKNQLNELLIILQKIESVYFNNKNELIEDIRKHNRDRWINKLQKTTALLDDLKSQNLRYRDKNIEIKYPNDKSLIALKNDAKVLLDYLYKGNSLSGVGFNIKKTFLSKEIKEKLYFLEAVFINGSPCDTKDEFIEVLKDIKIKQIFIELKELWGSDNIQTNSFENLFENFHSHKLKIQSLIDDIDNAIQKINELNYIPNIKISNLESETISKLLVDIENTAILNKHDKFIQHRDELNIQLSLSGIHPIAVDLKNALLNFDFSLYKNLLNDLSDLNENFEKYNRYKNDQNCLLQYFPNIIESISDGAFSIESIPCLKQAILYKNAVNELNRLLSGNYEDELIAKLKTYDSTAERLIAKIASKKAWIYVLDNLNKNKSLRQHLVAWVQAVRLIGKTGKGKRARKYSKEAKKQMEYCKTSVPCWIMPLYKVVETIHPAKAIYDYVIIDEASQLGPDAIFLLYISKNIIIVGDDKQTSPENVGVSADLMTPFIRKYLSDIPFNTFYEPESSFFDHAYRFCSGNDIVLREHFRCMPEIIEFSNKHFYAQDGIGLFPLKQYSENRLEPLQHYYCQEGYVDGQGARIQNKKEAEALSNKIYEIVNDDRYEEKSIGVICLQGNAQSSLIESLLIKKIGEKEYKKRKIICGDSASFQGDERDIIFLSLVTGSGHNRRALTRPQDERRFNVAVSRAIEQVWLFHSILMEDLSNTSDLRYKLLDHFINYKPSQPPISIPIDRTLGNHPPEFDSWFEVDVFNDIVKRGYKVKPQYEVAKGKYRIDLVAFFPDGTKIAIECDGDKWHGPEKYLDDNLRQKVLERCGWQFFRIRGGEYYSNRKKALEPLWKIFQEHEVNNNGSTKVRDFEQNIDAENVEEDINNQADNFSYRDFDQKNESYNDEPDNIIRYFNLFETGDYILSKEKLQEAKYIVPINSSQKSGYLLQCYESGHVNKVYISTLLSKKIDKKYMNGLNKNDSLKYLTIIDREHILGIFIYENGIKKFKAHLTENISCREQLHLKGYKVIYNDYDDIEYKILPIIISEDINRLVFQSFNANGKSIDNSYYSKEWEIINNSLKYFDKFSHNH